MRNPYKRIISGFIEKYTSEGSLYNEGKKISADGDLTFAKFVDVLIEDNFSKINKHHFTQQLSEEFDEKLKKHNFVVVYDISNIDYYFIEKLYEKKIPEHIICKKFSETLCSENKFNEPVYNLDPELYKMYSVATGFFYNEELKEKIHDFYLDDFNFLENNGFNYDLKK
jgi:hypothetical protein